MSKGNVIDVGVSSPELLKEIQLLKAFPEIAEKYWRPALNTSVQLLDMTIRPNIPIKSGAALAAFGLKVTGKGMNMKGEVGFWGRGGGEDYPWYIRIVEYGSQPHEIPGYIDDKGAQRLSKRAKGNSVMSVINSSLSSRSTPLMVFKASGGEVFTSHISHPGFGGRFFMKGGLNMAEKSIDPIFNAANEGVMQELAK